MAVRTTQQKVEEILGKDYDKSASGNIPLTAYIDTASVIVDKIALEPNAGSVRELEMVERWLAACLYCMSDKPFSARTTQGSHAAYMGHSGKGWDSNPYGQHAKRMDSSGYLWRTDEHLQASLIWLGTEENAQLDYEERN